MPTITTNVITNNYKLLYKVYTQPTSSSRVSTSYSNLTGVGGISSRLYKITNFMVCNHTDVKVVYNLKIDQRVFQFPLNARETLNIAKTTQPIYLSTNVLQHSASASASVAVLVCYQEFI